jgi:hypothetical protein
MKRWYVVHSDGTGLGSFAATIQEMEEAFGREGRDWYRSKHLGKTTLVILRRH